MTLDKMVKVSVKNETKEEKFKRLAASRTVKILDNLRRLGNCSNTNVYSYSREDVNKIFSAIEKEIRRIRSLFDKPKKMEFSLK